MTEQEQQMQEEEEVAANQEALPNALLHTDPENEGFTAGMQV
jgi:hypothetical protein